MSLFLKYRPQRFSDLVGQESVRKTLQNALKAKRPSHAYLFAGSRGTGKTSTARIFAKALNCEALEDGNPCNKCYFCKATTEGSLVDVIEIDAASNRGIDEIRDLREKINFAPVEAKRKIYIIDEVHMLTKEAFNALLKTLEEPPAHAFFCLATTEIHKIPETILSRCQVFLFQRFTIPQMVERLQEVCEKEGFTYEKDSLTLIAKKAMGGMRDALSLLEQVAAESEGNISPAAVRQSLGIAEKELLEKLFSTIKAKKLEEALSVVKTLVSQGYDIRAFMHDFLLYLREQMHQHLQSPDLPLILRIIESMEEAIARLRTSPIVELPLEIALVSLIQQSSSQEMLKTSSTPSKPSPQKPTPTPNPTPSQAQAQIPTPPPPSQKSSMPSGAPDEEGFIPLSAQAPPSSQASRETSTSPASTRAHPPSPPENTLSEIVKKVAQQAPLPAFARKSLLMTLPLQEEDTITLKTDSQFHKDQLSKSEVFTTLQKLFRQFLKKEDLQLKILYDGETSPEKKASQASITEEDILNF